MVRIDRAVSADAHITVWEPGRLLRPAGHRGGVPGGALPVVTAAPMIRVGSIVLRVDDLQRQAAFWEAALGYQRRQGDGDDFVLLRPKDGAGSNLSLDRHHSTAQVPPRIHLDLYTDDQAGEVRRLIALGATEVHWDRRPGDADYVILADPEGNRYCVVDVTR